MISNRVTRFCCVVWLYLLLQASPTAAELCGSNTCLPTESCKVTESGSFCVSALCGGEICSADETCYNDVKCVLTCDGWSCPDGDVCEDRSALGLSPTCIPENTTSVCGTQSCSYNETCYQNPYGNDYCIPNCNGWQCPEGDYCENRSHMGMWPVCVAHNTTYCGNHTCNENQTCYQNSYGNDYCVPNCNGWWCPSEEECEDRSHMGQRPVCVAHNTTNCGNYACNENQTCYQSPYGNDYCVANCNGWLCPEGEVCEDRSHMGKWPVCINHNGTGCGSQTCNENQTCYQSPYGNDYCVANCNGWQCPEGEDCEDRSHMGMWPVCINHNGTSCGSQTCNENQTCYQSPYGNDYCVANCNGWQCPEGEECEDRSHMGMWPVCINHNDTSCGNHTCNENQTCYQNSYGNDYCVANCNGWWCPSEEECEDRSHMGQRPVCVAHNTTYCGNYACNENQTCYQSPFGNDYCVANCNGWWCPSGEECDDRSHMGKWPVCINHNGTSCGSQTCNENQTCYQNPHGNDYCVANCNGWQCPEGKDCEDRSHIGMRPVCIYHNGTGCGSQICNENQTCYQNSYGNDYCVANCNGWWCPSEEECEDRSHMGQRPVCVAHNTTDCGKYTCNVNQTCYQNPYGNDYCVPNCNRWWCPRGEVCEDRSHMGKWPVCVAHNTTDCGNYTCNVNQTCYQNPYGNEYCVSNCNGWRCPSGEECKDRSHMGKWPVCVARNTTDCGKYTCNVNQTCYQNPYGNEYCVSNCNGWRCPSGEECKDRSHMGKWPVCVAHNTTDCGNYTCNVNQTCYQNPYGNEYCVSNCNGWRCPSGEECKDRSHMGKWPVCVARNTTDCGKYTCNVNQTCYQNPYGNDYCVPNCNRWWCPRGEVCEDRSHMGKWPVCVAHNTTDCGNYTCNVNQTCYQNPYGNEYCVSNCNGWRCPSGEECKDRSHMGKWPVCVARNTTDCGKYTCNVNQTCYQNPYGNEYCVSNCNGWRCPSGEECKDRSHMGKWPVCVARNTTDCGKYTCNVNQTCYQNPYGNEYCVSNCNGWRCPSGEECKDRSHMGKWPVCVAHNTTDCGNYTCNVNQTCYQNPYGNEYCVSNCNGWRCPSGEECKDRSHMGKWPVCVAHNTTDCGNYTCNVNQTCYQNPYGNEYCVSNCNGWRCPSGEECKDRSHMGKWPVCVAHNTTDCGNYTCNVNQTCYQNPYGNEYCVPNCNGWQCPSGEECEDRSHMGKWPVCVAHNTTDCGNYTCNVNQTCYQNPYGNEYCVSNCNGWQCPSGEECEDRSHMGKWPVCVAHNTTDCGKYTCNVNQTCYQNPYGNDYCVPNCNRWWCPRGEVCEDRSNMGKWPVCVAHNTTDCGNYTCNVNQTCYQNPYGNEYCVPNCNGWQCPSGEECEDRSHMGKWPVCVAHNTTDCGNYTCNVNQTCYQNPYGNEYCVSNCNGWQCPSGEECEDRSHMGKWPVCVAHNTTDCGKYTCNVNQTCYQNPYGNDYCVPNCNRWWCPRGEVCEDRSNMGKWPVCVAHNTTDCGNYTCNVNQTCYQNPYGNEYCVPNCNGWQCPSGEECEDRSHMGKWPVCVAHNTTDCGKYTCNVNQTCYQNPYGNDYCVPNCNRWWCPRGEVCEDRSNMGKWPVCVAHNTTDCGNYTCNVNQTCYQNPYGNEYCVPNCNGWRCPEGEECEDRSHMGQRPVCVAPNTTNCGNLTCNENQTCYQSPQGNDECIPNCNVWWCPDGEVCEDRSHIGKWPVCGNSSANPAVQRCGDTYCTSGESCIESECYTNCVGIDCDEGTHCEVDTIFNYASCKNDIYCDGVVCRAGEECLTDKNGIASCAKGAASIGNDSSDDDTNNVVYYIIAAVGGLLLVGGIVTYKVINSRSVPSSVSVLDVSELPLKEAYEKELSEIPVAI